ncbi:MAG TPA: DegT/DnrJ/EryC1/StrS family aminotransferase [Spirochaetia bacterium]|nr:DegT/DnrJ/EryC1/StrS family aminotransferase [Spirochaetia bacterium]
MPGPGFEWIGQEEEKEVLEVLRGRWLFRYGDETSPVFKRKTKTLEEMVQQGFGTRHALAVTSGTAALITALTALGIGPGDEVIVPGYTFIASMSSVIHARGVPVLAEVDESLTLDPDDVERKITPRTRAIMPVHMLGNPCNLERLQAIAHKHKLPIVEDAAQAFGGSYRGKRLGTIGKIGAYSFNIFKVINAGDGGMVVTDDDDLYLRAFGYHDQGHLPSRSGVEIGKRSIIGQNYRMNELTAAVLVAQYRRLDVILQHLRALKGRFKKALAGLPGVSFRTINDQAGECATLLTVLLPDARTAEKVAGALGTTTVSKSGWHVYSNMEQILGKMTAAGRGCPFDCESYPCFQDYRPGMLPRTDAILARAINLSVGVVDRGLGAAFGVSPHATDQEVESAAQKFQAAVREAI